MSEYTPTWESEGTGTATKKLYGGGLSHDYEEHRKTSAMEAEKPIGHEKTGRSNETGQFVVWPRKAIRRLRHPSMRLHGDGYHEQLTEWYFLGCGCGIRAIAAPGLPFPPEGILHLSVWASREDDRDFIPVSVESANPPVIRLEEDSEVVDRLAEEGCLICRGEE